MIIELRSPPPYKLQPCISQEQVNGPSSRDQGMLWDSKVGRNENSRASKATGHDHISLPENNGVYRLPWQS